MYRLNLKKREFGDFIILFLFDNIIDKEYYIDNETFNEVTDIMETKGMKNTLFTRYFDLSPELRSKYKKFKSNFIDGNVMIPIKESDEETNESIIDEVLTEAVKRITGKENPNQEKLNTFIKEIKDDILEKE